MRDNKEGYKMYVDKKNSSISPEIEDLFPKNPLDINSGQASENLYSSLITAYEQSIEYGLRPIEALTIITRWVSRELSLVTIQDKAATKDKRIPVRS